MKNLFYDTNSLLDANGRIFNSNDNIFISDISLKELENIKTAAARDPEIKYKARKVIHALENNEDKYTIVLYNRDWDDKYFNRHQILSNNNDSRIIIAALVTKESLQGDDLIFVTNDLVCKQIAKACGLNVQFKQTEEKEEYKGFETIKCKSEDEIAQTYEMLWSPQVEEVLHPYINQYFMIEDGSKQIIDAYKYTDHGMKQIEFHSFNSKHLGNIKPMDKYQMCLMDSMLTNKLTVCGGPAGTGKSLLSMAYLFQELEKGRIDRIIVFCNTVATMGSAKLGYYPGSREEKLLDSQIGNFLISKIGGRVEVENMTEHDQLLLLPMSDIRGFDTSGMNAGIYITEAQNMDIELMKLALQRIGSDSFCILDGDSHSQVDLSMYAGHNNGLRRVTEVFKGQDFFGQVNLQKIYRSKIAAVADKM